MPVSSFSVALNPIGIHISCHGGGGVQMYPSAKMTGLESLLEEIS